MVLIYHRLGGWFYALWDSHRTPGTEYSEDDIMALDDVKAIFEIRVHWVPRKNWPDGNGTQEQHFLGVLHQ